MCDIPFITTCQGTSISNLSQCAIYSQAQICIVRVIEKVDAFRMYEKRERVEIPRNTLWENVDHADCNQPRAKIVLLMKGAKSG